MQQLTVNQKKLQLFHISVKACVCIGREFLLIKEPVKPDLRFSEKWEFPGGRIDKKERIINTLSRELNEEIGLKLSEVENKIEVFKFADRYEYILYKNFDISLLETIYRVTLLSKPEIKLSDEHIDFMWVNRNTDLNLYEFKTEEQKELMLEIQKEICFK